MSLSESERQLLESAGAEADPVRKQQAVGVVLGKSGTAADEAKELLAASYLAFTQPSFHLIPRGDAMASEESFYEAYGVLATMTNDFVDRGDNELAEILDKFPSTLAPLRMVLGLTHNELAVAMKLVDPSSRTSGGWLKGFERKPRPENSNKRREDAITLMARTVNAVMDRSILAVPDAVSHQFHSKLDKRDTRDGWSTVERDAGGVPYSALLYQRYVGGVWRQAQDAYSEVKGDALLELPLRELLQERGVPHHHTKSGASGAAETAERYGLSPGPDFIIPEEAPVLVIESKVGEDGGTVRDKAARIKTLASAASQRGLKACALVDGKGWSERANALADVIIATEGRTYSLQTIELIMELPEIQSRLGATLEAEEE